MPSRSQHIAVASFLTIATFAITSGIQRSPGIPAQLSNNHINLFGEVETTNGITIRADEHNIFSCPAGTESPVATSALESTSVRFWAYEYSNKEPDVTGTFYISPGELAVHPQYSAVDTLRRITGGKRYYVMSSVTLQFACQKGLSKTITCGDGFIDEGEQCDDGNGNSSDGCSQCTNDFCKDSDGGERFDIRGVTRANAGDTLEASDACSGNPGEENLLYEYSCTRSNTIATTRTACPHGCKNDACAPGPVCGNGILEEGESCDVVHEGCNQQTCSAMGGYVCRSNVCQVYIPTLDEGGGGPFGGDGGQEEGRRQDIVLHSASITGDMFSVEYSKNFDTCVQVYTRNGFAGHRTNFACRQSNHVKAQIALSDFANNAGIRVGTEIKLCHGNDASLCSNFVNVSEGRTESSSASSTDDTSGKIVTVENANPDWDYSSIPTGISRVGQFKFTTAHSVDAAHQRGKAALGALLFTVKAKNTVISTGGDIRFYNKADSTRQQRCTALYPDGSPYTATSISGTFFVLCEDLRDSTVDTEIDAGGFQTFVIELNIVNPQLNTSTPSELQVSLENINLQAAAFGVEEGKSHVRWFSLSSGGAMEYLRFSMPMSIVKSTFYMSE